MTLNFDDLIAGESDANVDAKIAMPADKAKKPGLKDIGMPVSAKVSKPYRKSIPSKIPVIAPKKPNKTPSSKKIKLASLSLIPIAFKMPSCLDFCKTVIAKTDEMPKTTDTMTKICIINEEML